MIYLLNITKAKTINIKINGKRTRNHDKPENPLLHIIFNIHVQKKIYNILNTNNKIVLGQRME